MKRLGSHPPSPQLAEWQLEFLQFGLNIVISPSKPHSSSPPTSPLPISKSVFSKVVTKSYKGSQS